MITKRRKGNQEDNFRKEDVIKKNKKSEARKQIEKKNISYLHPIGKTRIAGFKVILENSERKEVGRFTFEDDWDSILLDFYLKVLKYPVAAQYFRFVHDSNFININEVKVFGSVSGSYNIARAAEINVKSTYPGYHASYLTDGIDDSTTKYYHSAVEGTVADPEWFELDFGSNSIVHSFNITNRYLHPAKDRIIGFAVILEDSTRAEIARFSYDDWGSDVLDYYFKGFDDPLIFRYLRFVHDSEFINVYEISVIGSMPINLALNKPATASSLYGSHAALEGNDGVLNAYFHSANGGDSGSWWQVDLGREYFVNSFKLFNRQTGDQASIDRIKDFTIEFYNNYDVVTKTVRYSKWNKVQYLYEDNFARIVARKVKVHVPTGILNFEELEVY
eukprot:Awhi_evm1s14500